MAQKLTFYCESQPIYDLIERYGNYLQDMAFDSLLAFNAVVSTFTLYYQFEESNGYPEKAFEEAVNNVSRQWRDKDPEAYQLCKAFCTETIDGTLVSAFYLVPVQKGLAEAIQCHHDY